jgi:hypothetical protein
MKSAQPPSLNRLPEQDGPVPITTGSADTQTQEEQGYLHALMASGFAWDEATQLLALREHLYENAEMRQRMAEDSRMHFVRWLYQQGEITEITEEEE